MEQLMVLALDACEGSDDIIESADVMTTEALDGRDIGGAKAFVKAQSMGRVMASLKIGRAWKKKVANRANTRQGSSSSTKPASPKSLSKAPPKAKRASSESC
jgi:hypothetical protein